MPFRLGSTRPSDHRTYVVRTVRRVHKRTVGPKGLSACPKREVSTSVLTTHGVHLRVPNTLMPPPAPTPPVLAQAPICVTCGVQYPPTPKPPARCIICDEPRQWVPPEGQQWTTPAALAEEHTNRIEEAEPNLFAIYTEPHFGIGQRALLVRTPEGNVLWDCVTLLNEATRERITELGGIAAIAVCHPHYYSAMAPWAAAFDCPIYIHETNARWVVEPTERLRVFDTETVALPGGTTLIRTGGHFAGSTVLHWPTGAEGRGAMLVGDSLKTTGDMKFVSFVRSSPNDLPLSADDADYIVACLEPYDYERLYSFRRDMVLPQGAKDTVRLSAKRHRDALSGRYPGGTALAND